MILSKNLLKILILISIGNGFFNFYLLFLSGAQLISLPTPLPSYMTIIIVKILLFTIELFLIYGLWYLYIFLQKNNFIYLKKFAIILLIYPVLKMIIHTVNTLLLSWHLGENNRIVDIDFNETTIIYMGFGLLIIYLSNLFQLQKK